MAQPKTELILAKHSLIEGAQGAQVAEVWWDGRMIAEVTGPTRKCRA